MSGKQMHIGHNHELSIVWPETTRTQPLLDTSAPSSTDQTAAPDTSIDEATPLELDPEVALKEHIVELEKMIDKGTLGRTQQMLTIARDYAIKAESQKNLDHPSAAPAACLTMSKQSLDGAITGLVSVFGSYDKARLWVVEYLSTMAKFD